MRWRRISARAGGRRGWLLVPALMSLVLTSCGPFDNSLGGDPCLLQQYQSHNGAIASHIGDALLSLSSSVAVLQTPPAPIKIGDGAVSGSLSAITTFTLTLEAQQALLDHGVQPPEGAPFRETLHSAIAELEAAAWMLSSAYDDAANGSTRAATVIVAGARSHLQRGRLRLASAVRALSALDTNSVNC